MSLRLFGRLYVNGENASFAGLAISEMNKVCGLYVVTRGIRLFLPFSLGCKIYSYIYSNKRYDFTRSEALLS